MSDETVDHPAHYNSHPSGVECIDIIKHMPFSAGSVIKYLWRAGLKDSEPTLRDLKKARWYLDCMIQDEEERLRKEYPGLWNHSGEPIAKVDVIETEEGVTVEPEVHVGPSYRGSDKEFADCGIKCLHMGHQWDDECALQQQQNEEAVEALKQHQTRPFTHHPTPPITPGFEKDRHKAHMEIPNG